MHFMTITSARRTPGKLIDTRQNLQSIQPTFLETGILFYSTGTLKLHSTSRWSFHMCLSTGHPSSSSSTPHHLPSWILQPTRRYFTKTAAAICGGPNRTTPGEFLPAPALAAAVLSQKRKTAEAKQDKEDTKSCPSR
jgi:hypothetical protein